jgi:EAL domain-containing protein (putative c-di-GMP-specific phosphodiesterase class I)
MDGIIFSAEALVRWKQTDGSYLAPDQFISVAEDTGLIVPLGEWILKEACNKLSHWRRRINPDLRMSINISPRQFKSQGLPGIASAILKQNGLPAHVIDLEITESVLMLQNKENMGILEELAAMGICLSIDDFGTGYSSLSYLQRFPVDTLKIDQSFVRGIHQDKQDMAIVNTILAMANSMELKVIAEGVENQKQMEFLKQNGCHAAQGYYFSRPIPADDFEKLILKTPSSQWN